MAKNDDEPRIQLGKYENGVLEIREGFKKLDDESMEGYEHVCKVIFPASLEELDEDVFSETKELEELDFSRVTKLKEIPEGLVSCKTKISKLVIPQGVKEVGDGFLSEAKKGTQIFIPASVKQLGYINGNSDNDLEVYLFASDIDVDDFETDVNTLYVLPKDYADYAEKLKDCDSEAKLREIPEELLNFYSNIASTAAPATQSAPAAQPTSDAKPAPAAVMSAPPPPPIPVAPKVDNQPTTSVASIAPQNANQQQTTNTKNMANNLIPQELETLIQEYLTDGVLTDKERQVLLRKAVGLGLDRDEIDLYLDAQIQKIDQATDAVVRRQKGKTCPFCGGSVPQLTEKCPHCGENITAEASSELQEIFDNLEDALVNLKSGKDIRGSKATVERYARKAKMYYGSNPKIQKLLEEIKEETDKAEKKAEKRAYFEMFKKHAAIYSTIIVVVLGLIGWGIYRGVAAYTAEPDVTDPAICQKAITDAIEKGNLTKAYQYLDKYLKANYVEEATYEERSDVINSVQSAMFDLGMAMIESGDVAKGLFIHQIFQVSSSFEQDGLLEEAAFNKYMELGDFDNAEKCKHFWSYDFEKYYNFLCLCIDQMKEKGDESKAKKFIEKKCSFFSRADKDADYEEWSQQKVKQKLLDYLDI